MDVLNIYSQRLGKNMPPSLATRLHASETDTCASQTELTCPPSKNISLQTKLRLKTSGSQTDLPSPKPPSSKILSLGVSTQTDIVTSPKNDNLEVSNPRLTGASVPHQQPIIISKPEEKAVNAPSDGPTVIAQSPPASKSSPMQAPGGTSAGEAKIDSELEEQKKRELIATLKAMDAQKDPPASQPVTSTATKSAAQPTSNVLVGGERSVPSVGKLTKQSTQPPTTTSSQPAKINDDEEAKKKKLLLAKLMAIDEGSDPSKVTMSKMDVSSKAQLPPPSKHPASGHQSSTSIQSWPETIENMYQGKPAFATEDDPFGSRHTSGKKAASTKSRDFFLTEGGGGGGGGGEVESSSSSKNKRLGRQHQLEQKQSSTLDFSIDNSSMKTHGGHDGNKVVTKAVAEQEGSSPVAPTAQLGYQPTFGRRAGAAQANKQKPKNGMIFGDFESLEPSVAAKKKTEPPSSLEFNFEASESKSKAGSTGSGRDYPWETRVNVSSNPQAPTERERLRGGGEKERRESEGGPLSSPSMVFGYVGQEKPLLGLHSRSKGSLLPLREKAGPGSAMPLDVAEPDDLEELAL